MPNPRRNVRHVVHGDGPLGGHGGAVDGAVGVDEHLTVGELGQQVVDRVVEAEAALLDKSIIGGGDRDHMAFVIEEMRNSELTAATGPGAPPRVSDPGPLPLRPRRPRRPATATGRVAPGTWSAATCSSTRTRSRSMPSWSKAASER